jgi:hypothetical protein
VCALFISVFFLAGFFTAAPAMGQKQGGGDNPQTGANAGDPALERFSRMTPEQRQKALEKLPPERRQEILRKFQDFQTLPLTDKRRVAEQLERLRSLPPRQQNQVRRALRQLQALPDDRRILVHKEMEHLSVMAETDRRARMNSEEFRNLYSPAEQQMMVNLATLLPEGK